MTHKEEIQLYANNINKLLNMGYHVYFKEHPKTPNMFFKPLSEIIKNPNFETLGPYAVLPMETLVPFLRPCAIVSMFSSSLFTMPWIFNIPSFTFMPNKEFKDHKIFGIAHMLVASFIPPIEFLHKNSQITENNFNLFLKNTLHIEKNVYYRIKNIDFFKLFISRREFYQIKKEIKTANKLILRYFDIPPIVINLFKNESYINYIKYYLEDFKKQYNEYKIRLKNQYKKPTKIWSNKIENFITACIKIII